MPRERTELQRASGKLTSSLGKVWHQHLGDDELWEKCDVVLNKSHDFLQAKNAENIIQLLNGQSISEYLGEDFLQHHPQILEYIRELEKAIRDE